jgi:hypothetical protein
MSWRNRFEHDPVNPLLSSHNNAIIYFTNRDLLGKQVPNINVLSNEPEARKLIRKQMEDGGWKYPGGNIDIRSQANYNQLETYRNLRVLVEKYGFDRDYASIKIAAEFLFRFQTSEGDFRGIYAKQYTPNYSAAILELLIKCGYEKDERVIRGLDWLLSLRQDDGAWAIPFRTTGKRLSVAFYEQEKFETLQPVRSKPSSYLVTGIVLRAFAAHTKYRKRPEIKTAGVLLKSGFFKRDTYPDRVSLSYWVKFGYPFWWSDLLTSLDSLSKMGFDKQDDDVKRGLKWFVEHQDTRGLWKAYYGNPKDKDADQWVTLAICRVFKRMYD